VTAMPAPMSPMPTPMSAIPKVRSWSRIHAIPRPMTAIPLPITAIPTDANSSLGSGVENRLSMGAVDPVGSEPRAQESAVHIRD